MKQVRFSSGNCPPAIPPNPPVPEVLRLISRRLFLIGLSSTTLAACTTTRQPVVQEPMIDPYYQRMYGPVLDEPYPVAAMDLRRVDPQWWRQDVPDPTGEKPGTLVVDTPNHFLYLVMEGGRAIRYGIGVGKDEALVFRGNASIGRKAEWPRWTPTQSMIAREPDRYGPYAAAWARARKIRSVRARSISTRMAATRCSVSTARPNPIRSAPMSPRAVSA